MEVSADQLKQAVEGQHGGTAKLVGFLRVKEVFEGRTVWEGVIHVFDVEGHPKATRAYAWSSSIEGTERRRFYAVLHLGGIRSPLDALRVAMVADVGLRDDYRSWGSLVSGKHARTERQDAVTS